MTIQDVEPESKRLGILRDALPGAKRVGILIGGTTTSSIRWRFDDQVIATARTLGLQARVLRVSAPNEIRASIQSLARDSDALLVVDGSMLAQAVDEVAAQSLLLRLPAISQSPRLADSRGLLQYGADIIGVFKGSARHMDKILRGEPCRYTDRATHHVSARRQSQNGTHARTESAVANPCPSGSRHRVTIGIALH